MQLLLLFVCKFYLQQNYILYCEGLACFVTYLFSLGNSACVDVASMMDVSGVCPGNMDHPACVMLPPTKRSKLYAFFVPIMLLHFE